MTAMRQHSTPTPTRFTRLRSTSGVLALTSLFCLSIPRPAEHAEATVIAAAAPAGPATPTAVPAYRQANRVAILTIDGVIDQVTLTSLERRVRRAVKDGADAVVLDI